MDNLITQTYSAGPLSALRMVPDDETVESDIYRSLIHYSSFNPLKKYDYSITNTMNSLLCGEYTKENGEIVKVYDTIVEFPSYTGPNATKILMRPHLARSLGENYMCKVYALCKKYKSENSNDVTIAKEYLGALPCMIGSSMCITGHKPDEFETLDEWKFALGEGIPPGYFIRNGIDVAFLHTVRQSTNTIFTTKNKNGRIVTRLTELHKGKTSVLRLVDGKKTASVKVLCPHIEKRNQKDKHYPLFIVYYILIGQHSKEFNIDKICKIIAEFAPKKERPYIIAYLRTSIDKFEKITGYGNIKELIGEYIMKKNSRDSSSKYASAQDKYTIDSVRKLIEQELSRSTDNLPEKIANFSLLVCEHIRSCIGLRPLDNVDHCAMKKLDDFGRLFEQYINNILKPRIYSKDVDTGKWAIGRKDSKENIIETLKPDSYPLIISTYNKANVTADERNKSFSIRQVQTTGYGGFCPVSTSEGKRCGMTSNIAICTRVSWNSEHIKGILDPIYHIRDYDQYISLSEKNGYYRMFIGYNPLKIGKISIYCSDKFIDFVNDTSKSKSSNFRLEFFDRIAETSDEEVFDFDFQGNDFPLFYNKQEYVMISSDEYEQFKNKIKIYDEDGVYIFENKKEEESVITTNYGFFKLRIKSSHSAILNPCFKYVNEYCSTMKTLKNNHILLTNSNILCLDVERGIYPLILWFNPNVIIPKIKKYIREGKLPIDTCVYSSGGKIYFRYDCGRIMEYVDMKYLDMTFIADTVTECRRFSNLRKFLNLIDLEGSDSAFSFDGKFYYNEDMSYVKIDKKKHNILFSDEKIVDDQLTYDFKPNGIKYAYYKLDCQTYYPTDKNIIHLIKEKGTTKRDGFDLCYLENGNLIWIKDEINMDDTTYNENQIFEINFKNRNEKWVHIVEVKDSLVLVEVNTLKIRKEDEFFLLEDDKIIWSDEQFVDGKLFDKIEGDIGEEYFFESKNSYFLMPVTIDMDYEYFNIEEEKNNFDKLEKLDKENDRECDFLMTFRRQQEHLDIITEEEDVSKIFEFLRSKYNQFKKRSNIYKIMRYLNYRFKFTHCPIDPNIVYSSVANLSIKANHDQGPRFTYQCQMVKQSLSIADPMYFAKPTAVKRAMKTEQHLVETVAEEPLYGVTISSSFNPIVATVTDYNGYEDALVVSESIYFRYEKPSLIEIVEKDEVSGKSSEYVAFPTDEYGNKKTDRKYRHLDDNGLPRKYSVIEHGDCICGMMRYNGVSKTDISIDAEIGQEGIVVQVETICKEDKTNTRNIQIKIASRRDSGLGAKIEAAHSQKGTLGHINLESNSNGINLKTPGFYVTGLDFEYLKEIVGEDIVEAVRERKLHVRVVGDDYMPKIASGPNAGTAIDIIFSPFSYPSRMTMGMNYEQMASKASLRIQEKMDGTSFHKNEMKRFEQILIDNGLDKHGCEMIRHPDGEIVMDVTTGKPLRVYICPCSYKKLRHDPEDKISVRFMGRRDPVTDQGIHGRPKGGGQRVGEMERDAFLSHTAAGLALDRLMYASDVYKAVFCKSCGKASSESDITKKICRICKSSNSLVIVTQTRIFRVVTQMFETMGLVIRMGNDKKE